MGLFSWCVMNEDSDLWIKVGKMVEWRQWRADCAFWTETNRHEIFIFEKIQITCLKCKMLRYII